MKSGASLEINENFRERRGDDDGPKAVRDEICGIGSTREGLRTKPEAAPARVATINAVLMLWYSVLFAMEAVVVG